MKAAQALINRRPRGSPGRVFLPRSVPANIRHIRHEPYSTIRPQPSISSNNYSAIPPYSNKVDSSPIVKSEPTEDSSDANVDNIRTNNQGDSNIDENSSGSANSYATGNPDASINDSDISVKLEAVNEEDLELEITGVEPGLVTQHMSNITMDTSYLTAGASGSPSDMVGGTDISKCPLYFHYFRTIFFWVVHMERNGYVQKSLSSTACCNLFIIHHLILSLSIEGYTLQDTLKLEKHYTYLFIDLHLNN